MYNINENMNSKGKKGCKLMFKNRFHEIFVSLSNCILTVIDRKKIRNNRVRL